MLGQGASRARRQISKRREETLPHCLRRQAVDFPTFLSQNDYGV